MLIMISLLDCESLPLGTEVNVDACNSDALISLAIVLVFVAAERTSNICAAKPDDLAPPDAFAVMIMSSVFAFARSPPVLALAPRPLPLLPLSAPKLWR